MADNVLIKWEIFGLKAFELELHALSRRAVTMEPALKRVGEKWRDWIEEQFDSQGRFFLGHKWPKLAASTISKKKSAVILIDSADLLLSATNPESFDTDENSVTFSLPPEEAQKGARHQTGASMSMGGEDGGEWFMPARPIISFSELHNRESLSIVEEWLLDGNL